jgi:predicted transcriptional regulator
METVENTTEQARAVELTADIVSAYVSKNAVMSGDLVRLIAEVHAVLGALQGNAPEPTAAIELKPAVSVKKSITPDFIICLEDGRSFKSLKRHLRTAYNMTPDEYRAKWALPKDYPMVAPSYSAARSSLATSMGLGQSRKKNGNGKAKKAKKPLN